MHFENQLEIGNGIYTKSEIAQILRLTYSKVNRWLTQYWNGDLGARFGMSYSWSVEDTPAVGFHTLVEFFVFVQFGEAGVPSKNVLKAHKALSDYFKTPFPFAKREVIEGIRVDGKRIFFEKDETILSLDGSGQFNLEFIKDFIKNLDFGSDDLAIRLWPLGKSNQVIIDPQRQFGHPVLGDSNIYPEMINNLHKAGEPIPFIAFTYEVSEQAVKDAIEFCEAA